MMDGMNGNHHIAALWNSYATNCDRLAAVAIDSEGEQERRRERGREGGRERGRKEEREK